MTSRPHDALFKGNFDNPSHIGGLYSGSYPPTICNRVDWSSARPEPGSFIDPRLDDRHTDLLFSARLRDDHGEAGGVLLYLLLEHQSTNDGDMPLRMYEYLLRIYKRHREQIGRPLAHVLPLLVTHAPDGWTAPCVFGDLFAPPAAEVDGLSELTPQFTVKVLDLSRLSNEDIERRADAPVAKLVLWLLRDGRHFVRLLHNIGHWRRVFVDALRSPSGDAIVAQLLQYVYEVTDDAHYQEFCETIRQQIPEAERVTMTMAEKLRQEGRQEGRLEGRLTQLEELLALKFGPLQPEHLRQLERASEEQLSTFAARILNADSIDAVLGDAR